MASTKGVLEELVEQTAAALTKVSGVAQVAVEPRWEADLQLNVDREMTAALGVTVEEVAQAAHAVQSGVVVGKAAVGEDAYPVIVRFGEREKEFANTIREIPLATREGPLLPLGQIVEIQLITAPQTIYRVDSRSCMYVLADVRGRTVAEVKHDAEKAFEPIKRELRRRSDRHHLQWID